MTKLFTRCVVLAALSAGTVLSLGCDGGGKDSVPKAGGNIDTTGGPRVGRGAPSGDATPPKATPKPADS